MSGPLPSHWNVSRKHDNVIFQNIMFLFYFGYKGAAHQSCNLNYNNPRHIPVIFHNMSGYDSHLLIKDIAKAANCKGNITLIAENKQKYISFTKYIDGCHFNLRFIDSFQFLPSSLDKLSFYMKDHPIVSHEFAKDGYSPEQIELLKRKGVYPYDYTTSFDSLQDKQLLPIEKFCSFLNEENISQEDYNHAQLVWDSFKVKNIGEYSDLYLKTDVLLLADIFLIFGKAV